MESVDTLLLSVRQTAILSAIIICSEIA